MPEVAFDGHWGVGGKIDGSSSWFGVVQDTDALQICLVHEAGNCEDTKAG